MKCTAIILAAGQGKRMKSNVQKQFLQLGEYPVLYYSLKAFQDSPEITDIVLVCGKTEINYCKDAFVQKYHIDKVSEVVAGGKERYESVYQGLCACHKTDYILIHDGARPFVTEELIQRGLDCAKEYQACAAGVPSKDTVKIIGEGKKVVSTPDRSHVWNVQTPQIFEYHLIKEEGPDHNKSFTVDVLVSGHVMGTGVGHTKKAAEQEAAYQAIRKMRK